MSFITWSDEKFSLKIPLVDAQHKCLVDLVNRMYDAVVAGMERSALEQILEELIDYTVYHFRTEEELFTLYRYPQFSLHKRQHDELTKQVSEFQNQFIEGSATISFEVMDFLHQWLVRHMAGSDRDFLYYMQEIGEIK